MSTKALVRLELVNEKITLKERIDFSFKITELGAKNKIGTSFGGNIATAFLDKIQKSGTNEIFFELTDDPIDVNAEVLFLGDGVRYFDCGKEIDTSKSLLSRMKRVQKFFEELLDNEDVKTLSVDIDALNTFDYQEFEVLNIKASDFANTMVKLFGENKQITPTVRINFIG